MRTSLLCLILVPFFSGNVLGQIRNYDQRGWLVYEQQLDSSSTTFTYDNMGNVTKKVTHDPCSTKQRPVINALGPTTFCSGDSVILSPALGLKYQWLRVGDTVLPNDTLQSLKVTISGYYKLMRLDSFSYPLNSVQRDTIQCYLASDSISITVKPRPNLVTPLSQVRCNGFTTDSVIFNSDIAGTTYTWTNSNATIGLASSGSGNIAPFIASDTTTPPDTAVITIMPLANGCTGSKDSLTIVVNPIPALLSSLAPPSICDSDIFNYYPLCATAGAFFTWSRASVIGISNAAASGLGNPHETLSNTTPYPISVTYIDTITANGCINTQSVTAIVNPKPLLLNTLTPPAICDSKVFSYIDSSPTPGTSFAWSRASVPGISNPDTSASGNPYEILVNTTSDPILVTYIDTLLANGCINTQSITVTVNPKPVLSSPLTPAICDDILLDYPPASHTSGTMFAWKRMTVLGISNAAANGAGDPNETLINTTPDPLAATYIYTMTANGCQNIQNVIVTVYPNPVLFTTLTPPGICDSTSFNYFPSSLTVGTAMAWSRGIIMGISNSVNTGIDSTNETLLNSTAYPVDAIYSYTLTANGCSNTQNVTVTVYPKPVLAVSTSFATCDSALFNDSLTSATPGTTFTWNRYAITGISNPIASGTNVINEWLANTTPNPIAITYRDTLQANGCMNVQEIIVTVNPTPLLSSTLSPPAICDSTLFTYTPTSLTIGATFLWSRGTVWGISNSSAGGIDTVRETLINTTSNPIPVIYTDTLNINGCVNTENVTVVINPKPMLTSALAPPAVCGNTIFNYIDSTSTAGTTYAWSRAAVAGISNGAGNDTGNIHDTLNPTTPYPVVVTYVDTLMANGCVNTEHILVTVNPIPVLSSTLAPPAICDSTIFHYVDSSKTIGTSFTWSRAVVTGLSNPAAVGSGTVIETLYNTTPGLMSVVYIYTLTANGCFNTENVIVTVNPTPRLISSDTASVCSGSQFSYVQLSTTAGTSFTWTRPSIIDISPLIGGSLGNITEVLSNATLHSINVIYIDTLTAYGCNAIWQIRLTVNPTPAPPVISTKPPASLCANTQFQNFGTTSPAPPGINYLWDATNATIWAHGTGEQYCLVNFLTPSVNAVITLTESVIGYSCTSKDSAVIAVGSTILPTPNAIYESPQFICLTALENSYQWGYDDASTLDSTVLPGEINQNYHNSSPDFTYKYYWVITTQDGCIQKSYVNGPTSINAPNSDDLTKVNIYPNPTDNIINVEVETTIGGNFEVGLFDMFGQKIIRLPMQNNKSQISLANFASASYLVVCYRSGIKIASKVVVKK